jgi:NADH:ubiquinone oxidoreductase subunit 4 (subunit M)
MLRAVRSILHGPVPEGMEGVADASGWWRKLPFALLFVALIIFGVWPRSLTDKIQPSAQKIVELATRTAPPEPAATPTTVAHLK